MLPRLWAVAAVAIVAGMVGVTNSQSPTSRYSSARRQNLRDPLLSPADWTSVDESRQRIRARHHAATLEEQNLLQFFNTQQAQGGDSEDEMKLKKLHTTRTIQTRKGLTVLIKQIKTNPTVAVQMWHKIGSHNESTTVNGVSHLLEHLLFKGTKERPVQFMRLFDVIGAECNAFTSFDVTVYHENAPKEVLQHILTLEADRLVNLKLTAEGLEKEKVVVLSELVGYNDNVLTKLDEAVMAETFPVPGYGMPVGGHSELVAEITLEQVTKHYKDNYGPDGAVLVIAGDVDVDETAEMVFDLFDTLPVEDRPEVQHMVMVYVWWAHFMEELRDDFAYSPYLTFLLNHYLVYTYALIYKSQQGWDATWDYKPANQVKVDEAEAHVAKAKEELERAIRGNSGGQTMGGDPDPDAIVAAEHQLHAAEKALEDLLRSLDPVVPFRAEDVTLTVKSPQAARQAQKEHAIRYAAHHTAKILQDAALNGDQRWQNPGFARTVKSNVYGGIISGGETVPLDFAAAGALQPAVSAASAVVASTKVAFQAPQKEVPAPKPLVVTKTISSKLAPEPETVIEVSQSKTMDTKVGEVRLVRPVQADVEGGKEVSADTVPTKEVEGSSLLEVEETIMDSDAYISALKDKDAHKLAHPPAPLAKDSYIESLKSAHRKPSHANEGLQSLVSVAQNSFWGGSPWAQTMDTYMKEQQASAGSNGESSFVLSDQSAILVTDAAMSNSAILEVLFPMPDVTYASEEKAVMVVLDEIISGGHMSLMGRYLTSHNVSWTGISTELANHLDAGWYKIILSVTNGPDELIKAEEAVSSLIHDIRVYDLDGDDLDRAKLNSLMAYLQNEGDLTETANDMGQDYVLANGDVDFTMKHYNTILKLTLRNVREFCRRFFREKMARLAVLTPQGEEAPLGQDSAAMTSRKTRSAASRLVQQHLWQTHRHTHWSDMQLTHDHPSTNHHREMLMGEGVLVQTSSGVTDPRDALGYNGHGFNDPAELMALLPPLPSMLEAELNVDTGKTVKLSNGMKVTLIPHDSKIVRISGRVMAGHYNDPIGKAGIAQVVANMLLKGSTSFSYADFVVNLDDDASKLEYTAGREYTSISGRSFTKNFQRLLAILVESLAFPAFEEQMVEAVKASLAAMSNKDSMSHDERAKQQLQREIFPAGHPYHTFTSLASIDSITRDDLIEFHKTLYVPKNTGLTVSGDFNSEDMIKMLEMTFGGWAVENLYRLELTGQNCVDSALFDGMDPDCEARCTKDNACAFYTVGDAGTCQIRSTCVATEKDAGVMLYAKRSSSVRPAYQLISSNKECADGYLWAGTDVECAERCSVDARCNYYTYTSNSKYCMTHEKCIDESSTQQGSKIYLKLTPNRGGVIPLSDIEFPNVAEKASEYVKEIPEAANVVTVFGKKAPSRCHEDWFVMNIINSILGGSVLSSRLGTHVRDNKGLTYGVYSTLEAGVGAGMMVVRMQTAPDMTLQAIEEVNNVLEDFHTHGVSEIEVDLARRQLLASHTLSLSTAQVVGTTLTTLSQCGAVDPVEELRSIPSQIMAITTEVVNEYIKNYLSRNTYRMVRIGASVPINCELGSAPSPDQCTDACGILTQAITTPASNDGIGCGTLATYNCRPGDGACPLVNELIL